MENNNSAQKSHKKFWIIGVAAAAIAIFAVSCTSVNKSNNDAPATATEAAAEAAAETAAASTDTDEKAPAETAEPAAEKDTNDKATGSIGDYAVSILDASATTDYQGKPAIVVNFDYTNNSSQDSMFTTSLSCIAYQNGVSLSAAIITNGAYNAEPAIKTIKPGAQLKVQTAYLLSNTTDPVTIEVKPLFSLGNEMLSKTFTF